MTHTEVTLTITLLIACQKIVALEQRAAANDDILSKIAETLQVMAEANLRALGLQK